MANEVKRLFSHAAVTSIGSIAQAAFSFLLLPFYSRYLPPDAFGKVELLMASVLLVGAVFMLGLPSALARSFNYEHSEDPERRRLAASSALACIVASTGAVALVCSAFSPWISRLLFDDAGHAWLVAVGASTLVTTAVVNVCTTVLRGLYRTVMLSLMMLVAALVNAAVAIALVLAADRTFEAPVVATAVSQLALALLLAFGCRDQLRFRFSRDEIRSMLAFGLPLILAGLSFYALSTADRYLIRYFMDEAAVGLYGMGVRVASVLSAAIFAPFGMVWGVALYDIARRDDALTVFARFTTQFLAGGLVLVTGLALFAELAFQLLLDERYWAAERVVGLLGASLLLFALSDVLKVGLLVENQTRWLPFRVMIAGACNLALDVWLIPRMGMLGAAVAGVLSFAVLNVMTLLLTRSIYPIPFERGRLALLGLLAVPAVIVYGVTLELPLLERHLVRLATMLALVAALLWTRLLDGKQAIDVVRPFLSRVLARSRPSASP